MVFFKFSQFGSQIRFVRSGILLSTVIMANVNTTEVDNKMLDNLLSDDELNISIIRESQTPITNTLETPIQKKNTLPSRRKSSSITEIENYISKKYDELALYHLKQQILSEVSEIIKCELDNAPKNNKRIWKNTLTQM